MTTRNPSRVASDMHGRKGGDLEQGDANNGKDKGRRAFHDNSHSPHPTTTNNPCHPLVSYDTICGMARAPGVKMSGNPGFYEKLTNKILTVRIGSGCVREFETRARRVPCLPMHPPTPLLTLGTFSLPHRCR